MDFPLFHRVSAGPKALRKAFTLVELLVALATFLIMLGLLGSVLNSVYRAWDTARRETEIAQNARAILSLIEKDVSPAVVSDLMQFAQNPDIAAKLPSESAVSDSDAIFFWAPVGSSSGTNMSQVGWFLTQSNTDPSGQLYSLRRYCRKVSGSESIPTAVDTAHEIYWLENSPNAPADLALDSRVVSELVLGFWIECLDRNGRNIPVLSASDNAAAPLRYNSAARFQMSPAGVTFEDGNTFHFTASSTMPANLLPAAIRVTILVTDEGTRMRFASSMPPLPKTPASEANASPESIESEIMKYQQDLAKEGIQAAAFSTVIKLNNAQNL